MSTKIDPKVAHQVRLEKLYSKNQTVKRIRQEFIEEKAVSFVGIMTKAGIPQEFGFDLLTQMALHKRCNLPTMVGILRHHYNDSQFTTDMILKCAEADLCNWNTGLEILIVKYTISADVQHEIDMYQFPLPMVVRPKMVRTNKDTGYFASSGSIILKNNHHDNDVCLDHINRVNSIRFVINTKTAHMVKNSWRNLDKPKEGETKQDFEKRKKAFEKYDRTAFEVMDIVRQHGEDFYLTHKYDKRGRTYCQGYHVNFQGTAWNKAIVELADKEYIL